MSDVFKQANMTPTDARPISHFWSFRNWQYYTEYEAQVTVNLEGQTFPMSYSRYMGFFHFWFIYFFEGTEALRNMSAEYVMRRLSRKWQNDISAN